MVDDNRRRKRIVLFHHYYTATASKDFFFFKSTGFVAWRFLVSISFNVVTAFHHFPIHRLVRKQENGCFLFQESEEGPKNRVL
jgi:hypothetical protein